MTHARHTPDGGVQATALEDSLTHLLRTFRRILHDEARRRDLTQAQYNALRFLTLAQEPRRMNEVADFLELTKSGVTTLIGQLEGRGLVARGIDPSDGRAVLVVVSADGRQLVDRMGDGVRAVLEEAFDRLDLPTQYMVLGGVAALAEALTARRVL